MIFYTNVLIATGYILIHVIYNFIEKIRMMQFGVACQISFLMSHSTTAARDIWPKG